MDRKFYEEIWSERPHRSQISDKWLGNEMRSWMFEHLIEKSSHPELRYEKDNIALVTLAEHSLKTNGFPLPEHKRLIEQAKKRFLIP